jgi:two-component system, NtrC family, response regulator HydG
MNPTLTLLAIDDESQNLRMVKDALARPELNILTAEDPEEGYKMFVQSHPAIVLLDLVMPKVGGIEILERIVRLDPLVDVILCTGHYSIESAVEAIQKGAADYLAKPIDFRKLRERVENLILKTDLRQEQQPLVDAECFGQIVGSSPPMLEVYSRIRRLAPHFRTLLISGATGTGKELLAQTLHQLSPARNGPFVVCNCAALVESIAESELFGHVRGSFTGAVQDKMGMFEHAHRGAILLDEVGELSLVAQAKLLRALQNREVQRVGSLNVKCVDVRVIGVTNRNLKQMVKEGRFRQDLYFRLAMDEIVMPPLVNRREDLPLLERHFTRKFAAEYKKPVVGLTRRAQAQLASYPWPGNVRELENVIGSACMMTKGSLIDVADLPEPVRLPNVQDLAMMDESFLSFDELEKRHMLRVLDAVGGNKARAAEILGIGRTTIYEMLSKSRILTTSGKT